MTLDSKNWPMYPLYCIAHAKKSFGLQLLNIILFTGSQIAIQIYVEFLIKIQCVPYRTKQNHNDIRKTTVGFIPILEAPNNSVS